MLKRIALLAFLGFGLGFSLGAWGTSISLDVTVTP